MNRQGRSIGMIVAVFALAGVGLASIGYVATDWATTLFLVNAQGETATRLGPVFVALVVFLTAVLAFAVGPVLAAVLGVLFGSEHRHSSQAAISTGAGAFIGYLVSGLLAIAGILLGIGAGGSAPFGIGGYLLQLFITAIPTAVVGAVAGVLGVRLAE